MTLEDLFGPEDLLIFEAARTPRQEDPLQVFGRQRTIDPLEFLSLLLDEATIEAHRQQLQELVLATIRGEPLPARFDRLRFLFHISDAEFITSNKTELLAYVTNVIFS